MKFEPEVFEWDGREQSLRCFGAAPKISIALA